MRVLGLTGSIGMGKTTAGARFSVHSISVLESDAVVHDLYRGRAVAAVEAAFPGTTRDGQVDRARLSAALLDAPGRFGVLEKIVHPLVLVEQALFLEREFARGARAAVLDIPLLFETGRSAWMDATIVVSAPLDVQRERVLARPGMTPEKFAAIVARQLPDSEKRQRADFVIDTSGTIEETHAQVDGIVARLEDICGTAYDRHWRVIAEQAGSDRGGGA
ncbi:MAG: dephospho-CoA kinase [Rhizobiales bacterium]|nr:dephospho-CoA kinase [Hyphomicrobiales bacterium]